MGKSKPGLRSSPTAGTQLAPEAGRWSEGDFEKWFLGCSLLPNDKGGEKVLVISHQAPLKRMVDIVALDSAGALAWDERVRSDGPHS